MIGVSIIIMQISLQARARLGLRISSIDTSLLFEPIAIVPAGSVFRPEAHTHPTEFVLTFSARHVVAATVLLYGRMAFGALLGIG